MKKLSIIPAVLLILLLLASCITPANDLESPPPESPGVTESPTPEPSPSPEPVLTELDPYVVKADVRAYLSEAELAGFRKAMDAVLSRQESILLSEDYDSNLRVLSALQGSPFFYFVETFDFSEDHSSLLFTYSYSEAEQSEMYDFIESEYVTALNTIISRDMNELDMVLAVYKYFGSRIAYDYEWLDSFNAADERFLFPDIEIYEALSTNYGVCHSYTYLFEFAMQQLGIECLRYSGVMSANPEEYHMWPVVRIDGEFYHCDLTWDSHDNRVGLEYFGMTDEQRIETGVIGFEFSIDGAYGEVICDSNTFDDFRRVVDFTFTKDLSAHKILVSRGGSAVVYDTQLKQLQEQ